MIGALVIFVLVFFTLMMVIGIRALINAGKPKTNLLPGPTNYPVLYQLPNGNITDSNNVPMYLNKSNQPAGPQSAEQVLSLLNSGHLSPLDLAIRHGEQQWQPLNMYFAVRPNQ